MRLLRVALRNYRGVADRDVTFAPTGVTIVEGPNEIGKSSMAEAIDRVLEELDSTSKRKVVATRPVDRDVGPEVTIEVETGPYAFHYHKRFLRERRTELTIIRPRPEQLVGREAHDRVRAMLAETVDVALWKALRIQQGTAVGQASLADQSSLSAALDRAAGEAPAGDEERALVELARGEYLAYWTETGRRKQAWSEQDRAVERAQEDIARTQAALGQIEADVEASARLESEVRRLIERREKQLERVAEHDERLQELSKLEGSMAAIEARRDAARARVIEAQRNAEARRQTLAELDAAIAAAERLTARLDAEAPAVDVVEMRLATAESALATARATRDEAQIGALLRRDDLSFLRDQRDLAGLEQRKARVDAALAALRSAERTLAANRVDDATLESIRVQHLDVERARARLDAGRPVVGVEALADIDGQFDSTTFRLAPGERLERRVEESLVLTLPGALIVSVTGGPVGDPAVAELRAAEATLAQLCRRVGAADVSDAERLGRIRLQADGERAEQRRILDDQLQELTPEALEAELVALRARTERYGAERLPDPPIADGEDGARAASEEADRVLADAELALGAAEREAEAARAKLADARAAARELAVEQRLATEKVERLDASLAADRAEAADEDLDRRRQEAESVELGLDEELRRARDELAREGPEQVRTTVANAKAALVTTESELRTAQDQLLEVHTRLLDHGEDGLAESLDAALAATAEAEQDRERYQRRAAARKLLYETLRSEREAARRAYVAPLRERIENLGSYIFGPGFGVQLDDELRIVSRTLGGQTVPFESLSVGAQEQLGLITRLACAMIVAPDGGVPLMLDDALGNSDPQRLEAIGAVLAVAGRHGQIIVLTCQPDRYQHVGGATILRLE